MRVRHDAYVRNGKVIIGYARDIDHDATSIQVNGETVRVPLFLFLFLINIITTNHVIVFSIKKLSFFSGHLFLYKFFLYRLILIIW